MSKVKQSGDGPAMGSAASGAVAAGDDHIGNELSCLREFADEAESISRVLRYVHSARSVFEAFDRAAMADAHVAAALKAACATWRDPDAVTGLDDGMAWLSAELHCRTCQLVDSARTIDSLRRPA